MENENQLSLFKGGLVLGLGVGLVGGVASTLWVKKRQRLSADAVLNTVKGAFLKEGSWINFEKQPLRKFAVHSEGYTGGITRLEDGKLVSYEFLADAKTGTVLDIQRLKE